MAASETIARSTLEVDGTWDIETQNWDVFVCGAIHAPGQETKVFWYEEEEAFVDALFSRKRTLWGHNAGRFDTLWLLQHVVKRKVKAKIGLAGSAISALEVDGAVFRDSMRLIPMSLKKAALIGGEQKGETNLPCECGRACGGYCAIRKGMSVANRLRLADYLVQDCRALYAALTTLCTLAERWDLDLKPTIGASAWKSVARSGVEPANWGASLNVTQPYQYMRRAYFGGRTQVLKPRSASGYHYDINSAYPAALASLSLPVGPWTEQTSAQAAGSYSSGKLGAYQAVVQVPQLFFPPLPVRTPKRIAYPVGLVGGWWTSLELANAERVGARIHSIDHGIVFPSSERVLEPFCRHVWSLRNSVAEGKSSPLGQWLKLYANSLTGKLATKPEVERVTIDPDCPVFCPGGNACGGNRALCGIFGCCDHACTLRCGKAEPIAFGLPFFSQTFPRLSPCSHVEWAAYLTAYTRGELLDFAAGADDGVYLDTDSLFCERARDTRIGKELGEWDLQDRYEHMHVLAPKTYAYTDETGKKHAASKGVPDAVNNFLALADGQLVANDRGVYTFKSAVREGVLFKRRDLQRRVRADGLHFGDRVLGTDGRTYPQTAKQIDKDMWELPS